MKAPLMISIRTDPGKDPGKKLRTLALGKSASELCLRAESERGHVSSRDTCARALTRLELTHATMQAAEEGGETEFLEIGKKIVAPKGSAVLFYNLKHACDGINPSCVDPVDDP
jgi:hypothetical protein